jgi:hypothetical protein
LGTWSAFADNHLARLDALLQTASQLPNWEHEQSLLRSGDYGVYWSLVWQLQVAEYFLDRSSLVSWRRSGPDLEAEINGEPLYIECYSYQKTFALESFLEDLLTTISPRIHVEHDLFAPLPLRGVKDKHDFLDRFFRPYLDGGVLDRAEKQAATNYPVELPTPTDAGTLRVYLDGDDLANYDPKVIPASHGDPECYIQRALTESISAKASSNELAANRPNALAVSLLSSRDFQAAAYLRPENQIPVVLPPAIDSVLLGWSGIDEVLTDNSLRFLGPANHILAK